MKKHRKPILYGCIIGVATIAIITCLLSFVLSIKDFPQILIDPAAVATLAVGAMLAGFIAAKAAREKGFLLGFICGLVIFLLAVISGLAIGNEGLGYLALVKFFALTLAGSIGGILGVNTRIKRK